MSTHNAVVALREARFALQQGCHSNADPGEGVDAQVRDAALVEVEQLLVRLDELLQGLRARPDAGAAGAEDYVDLEEHLHAAAEVAQRLTQASST